MREARKPLEVLLERWPGYTEQSWHQRFVELDSRYQEAVSQLFALAAAPQPNPTERANLVGEGAKAFLRQHVPSDAPFWAEDIESTFKREQMLWWMEEYAAQPSQAGLPDREVIARIVAPVNWKVLDERRQEGTLTPEVEHAITRYSLERADAIRDAILASIRLQGGE